MDSSLTGVEQREGRLGDILAALIESAERGEVLDRAVYLARHPEFAAELGDFFDSQDRLDRLAAPLRAAIGTLPARANEPSAAGQSFGDYDLVEELGRGGMGVVYKARQRRANRVVALKLLRADPLAGDDQARRFRNEAETVAGLDHPNFVPLYEVGEHSGRVYFSMKLIEGGSLAERLAEFATDPRRSAHVVATVARAAHHAHQRGVLHRDLKPANVLLDGDGRPYVTDFGLGRRLEVDSSLTQSGAVVGTPSYMAPEQAAGHKADVTTATDVYGLGAVLYALLTGRPPHHGETVLDTVERVRLHEPVSPRRINPGVNRDLETVCVKCLRKEPDRRYPSAEALAEDLERWLRGEPVLARRSGVWERAGKWVKRRPALAGLVTVCVLSLLLLIGGVLWHNARLQVAAERERDLAEKATAERDAAREQRKQARKAVDDMYSEVARKWLAQQPRLTEVQRDFLLKALRYYEEFVRDDDPDVDLRNDKAQAFVRVAEIQRTLGQFDESLAAHQRALALWEQLAADFPDTAEHRRHVARTRYSMAMAVYGKGRFQEAQELFQQALESHEELATKFPDEPTHRREWAAANLSVSIVHWRQGQKDQAAARLNRALELYGNLTTRFPDNPVFRHDLILAYLQKGNVTEGVEAMSAGRKAAALGEKLVAEYPEEASYRDSLATVYNNLTGALLGLEAWDEAGEVNRKARKLAEELVADFPAVRLYRESLARCHQRAAELLRARGQYAEELEEVRKAVRACPDHVLLLERAVWFLATHPDPQFREPARALELARKAVQGLPDRPTTRSRLALAHYRVGDWKAALAQIAEERRLRKGDVGDVGLFVLAMAHWQLGDKAAARRFYDQGAAFLDQGNPHDAQLRLLRAEAAALLGVKDGRAGKKESPGKK